MKIVLLGAGKVGRTFARALQDTPYPTRLRRLRDGIPRRALEADVLLLSVRDADVPQVAQELAGSGLVSEGAVVAHMAGSLDVAALEPLRACCSGIGSVHPILSLADARHPPELRGSHAVLDGDPLTLRRCRLIVSALGIKAHVMRGIDRRLYHAGCVLAATGTLTLGGAAAKLLELAGVPRRQAEVWLSPLLASVAANLATLGLPGALTGPVRRGDIAAIEGQLQRLTQAIPDLVPLYRELVRIQLEYGRALGEAPRTALVSIERLVARESNFASRPSGLRVRTTVARMTARKRRSP